MSNSHIFLKSGFIRTPSQNGVGRYICQLQRVVLKFCKSHGSSRGLREFIEYDMLDFAKSNPGIVMYLKPRRHRTAVLSAEYLNGEKQLIIARNFSREEINKWLNLLKTQNGDSSALRLRKLQHTDFPSIQGPWTPFTFRNPIENLVEFPNAELSKPFNQTKTASEELLEVFQKQQDIKLLEQHRAE